MNWQSMLRLRSYVLLALLTSFVIGAAYFASSQSDTFSSTAIPEVADYARDVEDSSDKDSLFIITAAFDQHLSLDWGVALNTNTFKPSLAGLYYRARPRSPPVQS